MYEYRPQGLAPPLSLSPASSLLLLLPPFSCSALQTHHVILFSCPTCLFALRVSLSLLPPACCTPACALQMMTSLSLCFHSSAFCLLPLLFIFPHSVSYACTHARRHAGARADWDSFPVCVYATRCSASTALIPLCVTSSGPPCSFLGRYTMPRSAVRRFDTSQLEQVWHRTTRALA